jgi:flagellum-specific peptidoglycan hydrolase FlgJ/LysM repeat protein
LTRISLPIIKICFMKYALFFLLLPLCGFLYGQQPTNTTTTPAPDPTAVDKGGTKPVESNAAPQVAPADQLRLDYIEKYKNAAISEMERTGIPASIKMAQALLESAGGSSELAMQANNHFGLKCSIGWEGRNYQKDDDEKDNNGKPVKSCFRKYTSVEHCYFDHSEFLRDPRKFNRYGYLFNLDRRDYKAWAQGLAASGYASDNRYAEKLINTIEKYRLYELDKPLEVVPPLSQQGDSRTRLGRVNDVKVVLARENETLDDIARIYRLKTQRVVDYNDFGYSPGVKLLANTRIFIQEKQKSWRGRNTHHMVREGQKMFDIAQQYGVSLEHLLTLNGLVRGQEPELNENIRLRGKRTANERIRLRLTEDQGATASTRPGGGGSRGGASGNNNRPGASASAPTQDPRMTTDNSELFTLEPEGTNPTASTNPRPSTTPSGTTTYPPVNTAPSPVVDTPVFRPSTTTEGMIPNDPTPISIPSGNNGSTADTQGAIYHTIARGDTLYSLARKYSTTSNRIKQLNNMVNDTVRIGQNIRVR